MFPGLDSGHVFIPSYLRILHVSQEPVLLNEAIWDNLRFGCPDNDDETRAMKILHQLGMHTSCSIMSEAARNVCVEEHEES